MFSQSFPKSLSWYLEYHPEHILCTVLQVSHEHLPVLYHLRIPLFPLAWAAHVKISDVFLPSLTSLCLVSAWGGVFTCLYLPAPILFPLSVMFRHLLHQVCRQRQMRQAEAVNTAMTCYQDQSCLSSMQLTPADVKWRTLHSLKGFLKSCSTEISNWSKMSYVYKWAAEIRFSKVINCSKM